MYQNCIKPRTFDVNAGRYILYIWCLRSKKFLYVAHYKRNVQKPIVCHWGNPLIYPWRKHISANSFREGTSVPFSVLPQWQAKCTISAHFFFWQCIMENVTAEYSDPVRRFCGYLCFEETKQNKNKLSKPQNHLSSGRTKLKQ